VITAGGKVDLQLNPHDPMCRRRWFVVEKLTDSWNCQVWGPGRVESFWISVGDNSDRVTVESCSEGKNTEKSKLP